MYRSDRIAHIHAKPGLEGALREVLESFVEPTRKEDGRLRFDLFVDRRGPRQIPRSAGPTRLGSGSDPNPVAVRACLNRFVDDKTS